MMIHTLPLSDNRCANVDSRKPDGMAPIALSTSPRLVYSSISVQATHMEDIPVLQLTLLLPTTPSPCKYKNGIF